LSNFPEMDPQEHRLCVRVSKLYYEAELTQQEIAKKLGVSRIKIHRTLNRAKEMGIVEIKVHAPENAKFVDQEHRLTLKYNLRDALVVPAPEEGGGYYGVLAQGASRWLESKLEPGTRIGLGLGRTISHIPRFFTVTQKMDCTFMEVVGGSSEHSGGIAKYNVTSKMAEIAGGRAELFYAPNFVSSSELRDNLISEPSIAAALERARHCDIVIQSVGTVDETAILYIEDRISRMDLTRLQKSGAVGDALGNYFDAEGHPVSTFLDNRVIGLSLGDLQKIPWSVVVAGGTEKHRAVRAGLMGGYFNVLVTDTQTASYLLLDKIQTDLDSR